MSGAFSAIDSEPWSEVLSVFPQTPPLLVPLPGTHVPDRRLERNRVTAGLAASQNRHGRSVALLIPTRGPLQMRTVLPLGRGTSLSHDPGANRPMPLSVKATASAAPTFPGPEASGRR